jgi:YHS domain-containing protein
MSRVYDPVSKKEGTIGSFPFTATHNGKTYYFESINNKVTFETAPDYYIQMFKNEKPHLDPGQVY